MIIRIRRAHFHRATKSAIAVLPEPARSGYTRRRGTRVTIAVKVFLFFFFSISPARDFRTARPRSAGFAANCSVISRTRDDERKGKDCWFLMNCHSDTCMIGVHIF